MFHLYVLWAKQKAAPVEIFIAAEGSPWRHRRSAALHIRVTSVKRSGCSGKERNEWKAIGPSVLDAVQCDVVMKNAELTFSEPHFQGARILITGGLGFIGSNLARCLVGLGGKVTVVDSLIPDYGGNLFNVNGFEDALQINISDVRDTFSMEHLVQDKDYLFNLAGQTSHLDSMTNPMPDLEINCRAQLAILEACRTRNPKIKIIFASTRQIYGKPMSLPVSESHPLNPTDVNGINKMAGEKYHLLYQKVYGIPTTVLRLTNTIGPHMRIKDARQTFVGLWIRKLLEGDPIEVWGGSQLRDFTDVGDAVNALLLAAVHPKSVGEVYNLGGTEVIKLRDLAELMIDVNGAGGYSTVDFPADRNAIDIGDFYADYSKIRNELGWVPQKSLRETIAVTLDYYRGTLAHYI